MAVRRYRAVPASERHYGLAEGPFWDVPRNRALWVDISAGRVHSATLNGESVTDDLVAEFAESVGAVVSSHDGELLVAGARRLYHVSAEGTMTEGPEVIPDGIASRMNDGKCDPAERFLVGTVTLDERVNQEVLVRVEVDGRITVIDDDIGLSNGLGFTPDGAQMYSIDSNRRTVWIRDYDVASGTVGRRREFLRVTGGDPDGMCVDSDGNLWIAIWGGGEVRGYPPAGEAIAVIETGAPNTTSAAFIGPDLDTLLITSASSGLSEKLLSHHPDSGRIFIADIGVPGLAVTPWVGSNQDATMR